MAKSTSLIRYFGGSPEDIRTVVMMQVRSPLSPKINVEMHYLWRVVDHEGDELKIFASKSRDQPAAAFTSEPAT